ncbi:MAG: hypothetical protein AB9834_11140 [Lentimicrobium sp.]
MTEYNHKINISPEINSRIPGYILVEKDPDSSDISQKILLDGIKYFFGGFGHKAYLFDMENYQLALMLPDTIQKLDCVSFSRVSDDFAFIEGTFSDFELLRACKNEPQPFGKNLANKILKLAKNGNLHELKEFNGRYSGFIYLAETRTLILITDHTGANRVFVYNDGKQFAVSNNVFALNMNSFLKISIDERSMAEILQLEYPLLRNTEFNEISLVLPSDIYIRNNKIVSYQKYYTLNDRTRCKSDQQYISDLEETIDLYFKRLNNYLEEPIGIFMSKGKDSRLFLPFLEKNDIPYTPFVFKDGTGVFDYPYVKKIMQLLNKDLHVLDTYTVDRRLAFMSAMSTTPTLSWFALGSLATQYSNTALMGLYGDLFAGKIATYRSPGIKTKDDLINRYFSFNAKGVTNDIFRKEFPNYNRFENWKTFEALYNDYPINQSLCEYDLYINYDYRTFRNSQPILLRAQHFITPITPFTDKAISKAYLSLPESLIKSQKAHAVIAAIEKKSNVVRSTAFPISLKLESNIRPVLLMIIKLNNTLNNRFLKGQIKKFNPYVPGDDFTPRSDYFKEILKERIPIKISQKRLLTRLYNADDYLHLIFHDNILPLCKIPVIVYNEFVD